MGFWHTGYMEFHEHADRRPPFSLEPPSPEFPCPTCKVIFATAQDLRVHVFEGHPVQCPVLVFRGRQCGRTRLTVSTPTSRKDWDVRNADAVRINGKSFGVEQAVGELTSRRNGVVDIVLENQLLSHPSYFNFAVAEEPHLAGVDGELAHLIEDGSLTPGSIADFVGRCDRFRSAARYSSGLAHYFYGVIGREGDRVAEPNVDPRGSGAENLSHAGVRGGVDQHWGSDHGRRRPALWPGRLRS